MCYNMKTKLITLLFISLNCAAMNFNYKGKEYLLEKQGKIGVTLRCNTDEKLNLFQAKSTKKDGGFLVEQAQLVNISADKSKVIIEIDEVEAYVDPCALNVLLQQQPTDKDFGMLDAKAKHMLIYDLDNPDIIATIKVPRSYVDSVYKALPMYQGDENKDALVRDGYEWFDCMIDPFCMENRYLKPFKYVAISNDGRKALLSNVNTIFLFDFNSKKVRELVRKTCTPSEEGKIPACFTTINYNDETNVVEIAHSDGTQQIIDLNTENKK